MDMTILLSLNEMQAAYHARSFYFLKVQVVSLNLALFVSMLYLLSDYLSFFIVNFIVQIHS